MVGRRNTFRENDGEIVNRRKAVDIGFIFGGAVLIVGFQKALEI